jgi:hypothetical protein
MTVSCLPKSQLRCIGPPYGEVLDPHRRGSCSFSTSNKVDDYFSDHGILTLGAAPYSILALECASCYELSRLPTYINSFAWGW